MSHDGTYTCMYPASRAQSIHQGLHRCHHTLTALPTAWIHTQRREPQDRSKVYRVHNAHAWDLLHFYGLGHIIEPPEGMGCEDQSWDVKQSSQGPLICP